MAHNQSRAERTESSQYRKSGRSNYHRNFSGGGTKGTSGSGTKGTSGSGTKGTSGTGGAATGPPPSTTNNTSSFNNSNSQPSLSSNRSLKKHNNVQGGISRASAAPSSQAVNSDCSTHSAPRDVQNGAHAHQPFHGTSDAPPTTATVRPTDVASPKATRAPRASSSNVPSVNSDSKHPPVPVTPAKAPADASRSFPLQFGSISPGLMNGMQIPARTSSAPPNLDEQKRDQARHDSLRAPPTMPIPSIPRQQLPKEVPKKKKKKKLRKEAGRVDQSNAAESNPIPKPKRDAQVSAVPATSQTQKPSVHPIPGLPMQMPFHQPQVPVQFGGPNPQIQSQAISSASLPMPMPIPMPLQIGSPAVQQPVFVSGLQPHPMQSQGILHQGQNLTFTYHMGPQIPQQLGNIGINIAPQYPQQEAGKFGGPRKAVKIIHPETQEELTLDGSPAPRSHTNVASQSQPISSFPPAHPANYYPNSYNANSLVFPPPSSIPLNTSHPPSQPPRYYNQARHDSLRALPAMPIPSIPRQQLPKEAGRVDQANATESHPIPKPKRVAQVSAVPATSQTQKPSVHSIPGLPMQMPFHQPQVPVQIGKVTDEEEAKQRQLKAILNKLTPQNFEKLFEQVKQINIDNVVTLTGVISQIFDKALMEPTFCEMYVNFCYHLAAELPDLSVDNEKITFKRLLLNKCQEEFEREEKQEESNKADEEGEAKQSAEEREKKRRRRMLGNIRLIGELYKKRMLTERVMHECIKKLLGQYQNPDEEDIEALCELMSTIGEMIDHPKAKEHMDFYFDMMEKLSRNMKLSSRVRFMLKDAIDLRKNKWQQRRKVEGPKKIEIGKVTDEEEAKQRQLKAILNTLTPQNFEKLFEQVKHINIDNAVTLTGVISQIFDKALMEPTFCEMYANFCYHLAAELPDLSVDNEKITFKRLLLNKCQEEFERGEREQEEANKADEEGEAKQSAEEREEKRRRRMLGNIRLIGELYKKRMLTERIMHECIKKLLGQYQNPYEEDFEALCKLMSTIGEMIDQASFSPVALTQSPIPVYIFVCFLLVSVCILLFFM